MNYFSVSLDDAERLAKRHELTIAVIGQGKMGLPIDVVFLEAGFEVVGVDIDKAVVKEINKGNPPIVGEPGVIEGIREGIKKGKFTCTTSLDDAVTKADVIIIIIPTLIDKYRNPVLTPLTDLIKKIGHNNISGKLIIIESTVPPLTTNNIIKKYLEQTTSLKAGKDFGLGFAPERTYSGRAIADIRENYPKIIGGVDPKSTKLMSFLYGEVCKKGVIKMSSATAAEAVKVFKGVYRDVNIALANELSLIAEKINVDIYEVIAAANSEPFSHIHQPGPGVGGHCIPVYPQFLINIANDVGIDAALIKKGREINLSMPNHVVNKIILALNKVNKNVKDKKITLLGLAYRGNVKEHRYSPTLDIIRELKQYEGRIVLHDPLYSRKEVEKITDVEFIEDIHEAIDKADCIVILTDHNQYKSMNINDFDSYGHAPYVIVDTRNIFDLNTIKNSDKRIIVK